MITASYDRHVDLGCEVLVFIDSESGDCLQIQRDLPALVDPAAPGGADATGRYCLTTGVGAPVYDGIEEWRRRDDLFEFALTPRAARMFGGNPWLEFRITPIEGSTVDDIAEHLRRLVG
ncbi:hypothetical protein GCM10027169_02510 [Gordonia jinhuaensis]|uniref:Uncharacterized protein n=1 Tax=Gordonia jinhuaensis TaxID=1517702 RepID=A0A916T2T9_9ACTN|nr:hypothetical protein [Gordonia jinhuaensis]GGB28624.1 hypothetical protein GCM10011489_16040 [Gordonia jinhuaensis]